MKRITRILLITLCLLSLLSFEVLAADERLVDEADLLSSSGYSDVEDALNKVSRRHDVDIVIVTVDSTDVVLKSVAPDGTVIDVPFTINGGVITFEAPGGKFCYYALAAKSGAVAPPPTNPDTGILFDEVSWFGMMLLCASALGILLLIRKRQLDLDAM